MGIRLAYGPNVDLNRADVFTMVNEHSYAAFVGVLSNIFMKAHACANVRTEPYSSALVIDKTMTEPYCGQPESSLTRLIAIIERFENPAGDIRLAIFVSDEPSMFCTGAKIGLKHTVSQCWLIKQQEIPKLVSINVPPLKLNKQENVVRFFTTNELNVKGHYIDYNTPIKSVFAILDQSKAHFCYQGGTAWLSICMNIPTYIVHNCKIDTNSHHQKFKLFGQDLGNINILNNNKIEHVRQHSAEHHIMLDCVQDVIKELV